MRMLRIATVLVGLGLAAVLLRGQSVFIGTLPTNCASDQVPVSNGGNGWSCGSGGGGAPTDAEYWVGAASGDLSAEKNLGSLATGFVVNTSGTPTAYAGSSCSAGQTVTSISASGVATCAAPEAAGASTQIQFNTSDALAASSAFVYTETSSKPALKLGPSNVDTRTITLGYDSFGNPQIITANSPNAGGNSQIHFSDQGVIRLRAHENDNLELQENKAVWLKHVEYVAPFGISVAGTTMDACGTTSPTILGTDNAFEVTVGATSGTSCTVTFGATFGDAPVCIGANATTSAQPVKAAPTATTVVLTGTFAAADKLNVICSGIDR